jgi:hypothetical protein
MARGCWDGVDGMELMVRGFDDQGGSQSLYWGLLCLAGVGMLFKL